MTLFSIEKDGLKARVSTQGGVVQDLFWSRGGDTVPLLRPGPQDEAGALAAGCFPLVPFGNRVRNNRFQFEHQVYALSPNTAWDPHYLHGEGWLANWQVADQSPEAIMLRFEHTDGEGTPYRYEATQRFAMTDGGLHLTLSVTNRGKVALPFGLGWHPYFPMTPQTRLTAPAALHWTEVEGWLPGERAPIPEDIDFHTARGLPHRWVNNGFEDWSGEAIIDWPEFKTRLTLSADPLFRHAFIFVSDTTFDPTFHRDYFCFEPMSHLADGQNLSDLGGLIVLQPGETLAGSIRLTPSSIR